MSQSTDDTPILESGSVVDDRYRVLSVAGQGGMGVVYKAQHIHINRTVALKMLIRGTSDRTEFTRFKQEADAASLLRHPNIVTIYDFGPIGDDQFYLAMDYLDGMSLNEEIIENGPLPLDRFKHIFTQACSALEHAHSKDLVHRDIKSANLVLVNRDGDKDFVVVVDFGLVKVMQQQDQGVTTAGTVVGSPLYMSPEQCRGIGLDHRTDIYSLGCVMYQALTGSVPFLGETMMDTIYLHMKETPPAMREVRPGAYIPAAVEQVIMKALSKNPSQRQQTMSELRDELMRSLSGAPDQAPLVSSAFAKTTSSNVSKPQNISRQATTADASAALTQQEASQLLTNQLLNNTLTTPAFRKGRRIPIWFWRLVSGCIVIAVIAGSTNVMLISLKAAVKAHRKDQDINHSQPVPATNTNASETNTVEATQEATVVEPQPDSGSTEQTIEVLKAAIAKLPEGSEESIRMNLQLCQFYSKLGDDTVAEPILRKCIENSSSMPELKKQSKEALSALLIRQGRPTEAQEL